MKGMKMMTKADAPVENMPSPPKYWFQQTSPSASFASSTPAPAPHRGRVFELVIRKLALPDVAGERANGEDRTITAD